MAAVLRTRHPLWSLKLCLRSSPALLALLLSHGCVMAQPPSNAGDSLKPAHPLTLQLHPREYRKIDVALASGKYNEIRIESPGSWSLGVFLKALPGDSTASDPVIDPYISDSGESFVRIPKTLEPSDPGNSQPFYLQLTALRNSKSDTRPVTATLTLLVEDASPHTALVANAINTFAHAERIRRERGTAEKAIPAYDEALQAARALDDKVLQQRVLLSKARFLDLDGRHYAEAVQFAQEATKINDPAAPASVQAMAWKTLGSAYTDMDRYAEGIAASKHAADLFRQAGDTYWLGIVLENLGEAQQASGSLDAALATDTEALRIARELKDDYGIIEMLSEIGAIHRSRSEYQEALNDFSSAVELSLPSSFNPMQAEAWSNLGGLYAILGEADQATPAYQHALSIAQSTHNGIAELEVLNHMAQLQFESGQQTQAEQTFTQALARAQELKLTRQQSALLTGLAQAEVKAGKFAEAASHLRQAQQLAAQIHQPYEQAGALEAESQLAQAQGRSNDAEAALQQANAMWQSLPENGRLAEGLAQLASVELSAHRLEPAADHLQQAMDLIETSRRSIARGALRTQYFALQHHTYDLAVYTAMQLDQAHPRAGYAARAWQIAERARARSLLDSLANDNAESGDPALQPLRERLTALGKQIEDSQDQIAHLGTAPADLENAARLQNTLHQSLTEEQQLESRLSSAAPEPAVTAPAVTPAVFARQTLHSGAALLEYWQGEQTSYVWLIRQDGSLRTAALPKAQRLQEQVAAYEKDLLARNTVVVNEDFAQRSRRLASTDGHLAQQARLLCATLLPPAIRLPLTGDDTILLVPDGSLLSVPFTALMEPGAATKPYLIQHFRFVTEPSAATAAAVAQLRPRDTGSEERVAVFADPVYSSADSRFQDSRFQKTDSANPPAAENITRDAALPDLGHLPRLPGSRQEALAIEAVAGPQHTSLHLGFEATPASVKTLDWTRYAVAHLAAHAVTYANQPETSGIVLSMLDSTGKKVDGMLWLRDIRRLRLAGNLVVLSGCGTASGASIPGEGLNSLSRAFLESGTRDVVATLWSADDATSSRLMQSFYRGFLEQRLTAPSSLRSAQLQMLGDPRHRSPYYWAGFIMEGAWQAQ